MTREEAAKELGHRLRRLAEWPVTEKRDLKGWYEAAQDVANWVKVHSRVIEAPHFFWHYISDADIRLEDAEYRRDQEEAVWELIATLEVGVFPSSGS